MRMSVTTTSGSSASTASASCTPVLAGRDQLDPRVGVEQVPERLAHEIAVVGDDDRGSSRTDRAGRAADPSGRMASKRSPTSTELSVLGRCGSTEWARHAAPRRGGVQAPPRSASVRPCRPAAVARMLTHDDRRHSPRRGATIALATRAPRRPALRATVRRPRLVATLAGPDAPAVRRARRSRRVRQDDAAVRMGRARPAAVRLGDRGPPPRRAARAAAGDRPRGRRRRGRGRRTGASCSSSTTSTCCAPPPRARRSPRSPPQLPAEITVALASRSEPPLPDRAAARPGPGDRAAPRRPGDDARPRRPRCCAPPGCSSNATTSTCCCTGPRAGPPALSLAALALGEQRVPGPAPSRASPASTGSSPSTCATRCCASSTEDDLRFVAAQLGPRDADRTRVRRDPRAVRARPTTLARLLRSGFPLVALDRTAERYRHHRLLADMLRAELRRTDAGARRRALHRRASALVRALPATATRALHHALAGGRGRRAPATSSGTACPATVEQGACATVEHWLSRFTRRPDRRPRRGSRCPPPACSSRTAAGDLAEHWLAAVDAAGPDRDVAGGVAALAAALGRDGLATDGRGRRPRVRAARRRTVPCQALCGLLAGVAAHLRGDRETARRRLEDGARRAAVSAPQIHALCLAQLALVALEDDDAEDAARLSTRARAQVARYGLARYPGERARAGGLRARARPARPRRGGARRRRARPPPCSSG